MIDKTKPIYERADGTKVVTLENGYPYHVIEGDPINDELGELLASHPEALIDEPVPPPPSAEELRARRVAEIKARLVEIDLKTARAGRKAALGKASSADTAKLTELDDEADVIRLELQKLESTK